MVGTAGAGAKLPAEGSRGGDWGIPGTDGIVATNVSRDGCGNTPRAPVRQELRIGYMNCLKRGK